MDIRDIAYEKYKLDWMISNNYTLNDYLAGLEAIRKSYEINEGYDNVPIFSLALDFQSDYGFYASGICFREKDDFLENEYLDTEYIKDILTEEEYDLYLEELE